MKLHPIITTPDTFVLSVELTDNDCWIPINYTPNTSGYCVFQGAGEQHLIHRWAWESLRGPIPPSLVIDHLCRNRACCNPDHLEPVTLIENIMRGEGIMAQNARREECVNGHPFNAENTKKRGKHGRRCIQCERDAQKRYYHKKKKLG